MNDPYWFSDAHVDSILHLKEQQADLISAGESQWNLSLCEKANLKFQVMALFIESQYKPERSWQAGLELVETAHKFFESQKERIFLIKSKQDVERLPDPHRLAVLLSIEGGEILHGQIWMVDLLYRLGIRAIGLTWNQRNDLADGAGECSANGGLTRLGKEVVKRMNQLGMAVDVSHMAERSFWDVLAVAEQPPYASHSCAAQLCPHPRNLTDNQLRALVQAGGIIGLNFCPDFLDPAGNASRADAVRHISHIADVVGTEFIALGSDFDGIDIAPQGLENVGCLPLLVEDLLKAGFSKQDIQKIVGDNLVKYFSRVLK